MANLREEPTRRRYWVSVVKCGYALVEAETEAEALELIDDMQDGDFQWTEFDDGQVVSLVD